MAPAPHKNALLLSTRAKVANIMLVLGLGILLCGTGYFGYQLHHLSKEQQQIKEDYSMVNNITFGIFSIDQWQEKISDIVTQKIRGFKITAEQKAAIREQVEKQLHGMVDQVVKEFTKPQKSIGGKLKKLAFKSFVDPKELHAQVPSFAKTIVDRITSPKSTNKLKNIATNKFENLAAQTYDSTQVALNHITKQLYAKYEVGNADAFNKQIETRLDNIRKVTYNYAYAMLGTVLFVALLWFIMRRQPHLHTSFFVMSLFFAMVLLTSGTTVSIIDLDARIDALTFNLMGETVTFENQVLFYQSQSILEAAEILIAQSKPDAITVGIIIIVFVIIFPFLRIVARGIHMLCGISWAENKVTRYLAFESNKWDMADVMVVGILMTYIGLNGILKSQLSDLNIKNDFLTAITVNYTTLQPGFIIFAGYVAFGFIISYMLKHIVCDRLERAK